MKENPNLGVGRTPEAQRPSEDLTMVPEGTVEQPSVRPKEEQETKREEISTRSGPELEIGFIPEKTRTDETPDAGFNPISLSVTRIQQEVYEPSLAADMTDAINRVASEETS